MTIEQMKKLIPNSENFVSCTKLNLGWSDEDKYVVGLQNGTTVLLRVLKIEGFYSQKKSIDILNQFSTISDLVPRVLDYGETTNGENGYILLSYIEGENAMKVISNYDIIKQYNFGLKMGEVIKLFHKQSKPEVDFEGTVNFNKKVKGFLDYYCENKSNFNFLKDKEAYIRKFLEQIKNRPFIMLHNDFHLGNMIINDNKISLIDFNRASVGDNIKEFDGIAWSVKNSEYFAQGLIDAYLEDENEQEFFELLKGYINIWQIQMLFFIRDQDDEEKEIVINLLKSVEEWYDKDGVIPSWYK